MLSVYRPARAEAQENGQPFFIFCSTNKIFVEIYVNLLKQLQATKMSMGVDVCMTYERRFYFNLPEVQKALHANRTHLPYSWSMCSG